MRQLLFTFIFLGLLAGCGQSTPPTLDDQLQAALAAHAIAPLDPGASPDPAKVTLGQALFFDKLLSGNRNISCATCHHPSLATGDGLPLSIGTNGQGLGPERILGYRRGFVARNAPELFNRGAPQWRTMFWDNRVAQLENGRFSTPAADQLPPGLDSVLAVQAMFPVIASGEMRGFYGDWDVNQQPNELALWSEFDFAEIWAAVMARILAEPEYVALFAAAYPGVPAAELGFQYAANAIAAFEIAAFTLPDSPWDRYLTGKTAVLPDAAKRGAILFYGDANCAVCHSGSLLTDQQPHNIAVPQVGPGKGEEAPLDFGHGRELENGLGRFAFRTPPLRNVAVTGPYMHNGAYASLETAVRHHLNPAQALQTYDETAHLPPDLWGTFQDDELLLIEMLQALDGQVRPKRPLTDAEIGDILAFLEALTDTAVYDLDQWIPASVPSGLPVND